MASNEWPTPDSSGDRHGRLSLTWRSPATAVAVVIILAFIALIVLMIRRIEVSDQEWTRLVYLFGSVEAIVFAAAGALFGTQVQRAQTQEAQDRARHAEQRAERHGEDAVSGRALAKAVKAGRSAPPASPAFAPPGVGEAAASDVDRLAVLAEELFPDV